jgi:CheY-like chemotaxis protein
MPNILVVDDEAVIRTLVRLTLEPLGYQVLEAAEGATALALSERCQPDLILLDVALPHISGLEVARRLDSRTPVLFLTGLPYGEELEAETPGIRGSIEKPFSPVELARRVEQALESPLPQPPAPLQRPAIAASQPFS